jgi:hypothetical protein
MLGLACEFGSAGSDLKGSGSASILILMNWKCFDFNFNELEVLNSGEEQELPLPQNWQHLCHLCFNGSLNINSPQSLCRKLLKMLQRDVFELLRSMRRKPFVDHSVCALAIKFNFPA